MKKETTSPTTTLVVSFDLKMTPRLEERFYS